MADFRDLFGVPVAAYVFLTNGRGELLLLRREGTGWCDGLWSVPAGCVEVGESARSAAARELAEETGVVLKPWDLLPVHVMHRRESDPERVWVDVFFAGFAEASDA